MRRLAPRWRKMTWLILVWTAVFAFWVVAAVNNAAKHTHAYCVQHHGVLSIQACEDASNTGTGIGVVLIVALWFLGFIVLSLVWFMTRPKGRACPRCGAEVKRGLTACPTCGYSFAAALAPEVAVRFDAPKASPGLGLVEHAVAGPNPPAVQTMITDPSGPGKVPDTSFVGLLTGPPCTECACRALLAPRDGAFCARCGHEAEAHRLAQPAPIAGCRLCACDLFAGDANASFCARCGHPRLDHGPGHAATTPVATAPQAPTSTAHYPGPTPAPDAGAQEPEVHSASSTSAAEPNSSRGAGFLIAWLALATLLSIAAGLGVYVLLSR